MYIQFKHMFVEQRSNPVEFHVSALFYSKGLTDCLFPLWNSLISMYTELDLAEMSYACFCVYISLILSIWLDLYVFKFTIQLKVLMMRTARCHIGCGQNALPHNNDRYRQTALSMSRYNNSTCPCTCISYFKPMTWSLVVMKRITCLLLFCQLYHCFMVVSCVVSMDKTTPTCKDTNSIISRYDVYIRYRPAKSLTQRLLFLTGYLGFSLATSQQLLLQLISTSRQHFGNQLPTALPLGSRDSTSFR